MGRLGLDPQEARVNGGKPCDSRTFVPDCDPNRPENRETVSIGPLRTRGAAPAWLAQEAAMRGVSRVRVAEAATLVSAVDAVGRDAACLGPAHSGSGQPSRPESFAAPRAPPGV